MARQDSTRTGDGCYHIVRWARSGTYATIALRRCYKSRSAATTASRRGLTGDRSRGGDHLEPHGDGNFLAVVKCNPGCRCTRWPTGCNADNLPVQALKAYLVCERCGKARRKAVELTDPKDEVPRLFCVPCAEKRALAISFGRRQAIPHWRHADDPEMLFLTILR